MQKKMPCIILVQLKRFKLLERFLSNISKNHCKEIRIGVNAPLFYVEGKNKYASSTNKPKKIYLNIITSSIYKSLIILNQFEER